MQVTNNVIRIFTKLVGHQYLQLSQIIILYVNNLFVSIIIIVTLEKLVQMQTAFFS